MSGRGTPAVEAARRAGIAHTVHEYTPAGRPSDRRGAWGLEAAHALGVAPDRVFKTLVVRDDEGRLAIGVVPVDGDLDLKAIAAALGTRRTTMADPADAERASGYVVGGISPLGWRRPAPVVVDESAVALETILVSGGRRGLDLELRGEDLVRLTGARVARIARPG